MKALVPIKRLVFYYQLLVQYFIQTEIFLFAVFTVVAAHYVYLLYEHFQAHHFLTLPLLLVNLLRVMLYINTFGIVNTISSQVLFAFTFITFAQLKAVNTFCRNNRYRLSVSAFRRFRRCHTDTVVTVLKGNLFFGPALLVFYVLLVPVNTYLLIGIAFRQFTLATSAIFANIILLVYVAIALMHVLASTYCKKIHRCSKPLLSAAAATVVIASGKVNSKSKSFSPLPATNNFTLHDKFQLANYIAKFHVLRKACTDSLTPLLA